jgi:ankyrin repeat protein
MAEYPLMEAAKRGDYAEVRERLERGDDVDKKDGTGCNALIWAANNGHTDVVQLLIDHGADLSVTTRDGRTIAKLAKPHRETAAVVARATQKPRKPEEPEKWVAMGAATVAFVGNYPGIERRLTQVFNFETRQQLVFSENLRTRAETAATPVSFDDLPQAVIEKALAEFTRLGGTTDRDLALYGENRLAKPRNARPLGPSSGGQA